MNVQPERLNRAPFHLEIDLAANHVHDVAADPDLFAVLAQMDAAGSLERSALGRDIGRLGESRADEPLREARIQAAGDRVLVSAAADERPHLEGRVVARFMRTDHAQLERIERGPVGLERKDLARGPKHHRTPARAVVDPLMMNDVRRRQSERRAIFASTSGSSAPVRRSGGAANSRRGPSQRT